MEKNHENTLANIENLLLGQKKVLNIEEFCQYTGFSKSFVYKLTSQRKLKFYRPSGKLIMFAMEDIQSFLLSNPVASTDDIEQESISHLSLSSWREMGK